MRTGLYQTIPALCEPYIRTVKQYERLTVDAVREKVYADSGVLLEPEIKFVGERG